MTRRVEQAKRVRYREHQVVYSSAEVLAIVTSVQQGYSPGLVCYCYNVRYHTLHKWLSGVSRSAITGYTLYDTYYTRRATAPRKQVNYQVPFHKVYTQYDFSNYQQEDQNHHLLN
jgi:hypothetical protein